MDNYNLRHLRSIFFKTNFYHNNQHHLRSIFFQICETIIFILFTSTLAAQNISDTIFVNQTIVYKTKNASEVTMVWGINEWKLPEEAYRPKNSTVENNILYTPMEAQGDSFYVSLRVPENTYVNYIFWYSKDKDGSKGEYWDKNGDHNYNLFVNKNGGQKVHVDTYSHFQFAFNLFSNARKLFLMSLFIFLPLIFFRRGVKRIVSKEYLIAGTALAVMIVMFLARYQLNLSTQESVWLLTGAGFYDLAFVAVFTLISIYLIVRLGNGRGAKIIAVLSYSLLLVFMLMAVMNIELVRHLGTPLNYQWLYYSGFLQSADAANAMKKNMNADMYVNMFYIIAFVILAGMIFNLLLQQARKRSMVFTSLTLIATIVLTTGFFQLKANKFEKKRIVNPTVFLVSSFIKSGQANDLYSMKVSDDVKSFFEKRAKSKEAVNDSVEIKNVIIFVLESTPREYLQPYGSKYPVTPNLERWKKSARIFENIYAHVPATPNSLFSIVSGMYPDISYKLTCNEKPDFPVRSIAASKDGWKSGVFSAADINFNNMGTYLDFQGFDTVVDFRNFKCAKSNFMSDWEYLDGVEDICMVNGAMQWMKDGPGKKLLLCWTMQTHYPYFVSGEEKIFDTANQDFNRYLNALCNSDSAFGVMMNDLEERKLIDETLVIVVGDHGEAFGRHDQTTHGSKIYEENVHVPCMLINPRLFAGEADDRIGGIIDIAPTIARLTGLAESAEWQGNSLTGNEKGERTFFFCPYADFLFGTRWKNFKLIYNATNVEFELYDLEKDPEESHNIAKQNPEIVKREYEYIAGWVQSQAAIMKQLVN